ncbi:apoptosis-stimulating of p53 protein 2a isoform X3 [Scleropages formosus]|uniref:apoptosis-stimulating of p53 protein 2a isoform X3 n=1 Tax=Scleropages formosus TaxID=113540 RepID=UPI0010FAA922|nr:apoptosis-stimulating of p53 protein 2 isoform X3 [Scleropages formosus]
MRYEAKMMPMFLTVYLSNNDQHFTEVPITPETVCRDVVELCKEPGEENCYLAERWRGSERAVGDNERMLDILQHWGPQRSEVRFFLRHERVPGRESAGGSRGQDHTVKRNGVKTPMDRRMENGVSGPRMDMTLAELQEMATRQQQQIEAQQQLLASKEQRLRYLKQQDQRQQHQASEQEKLQRLRERAETQEARLRKVRSLKGQVEQKRLSNGKLVEEIEQMSSLFQQKQRELVAAVSKVEELSRQLEMLKNGRIDALQDGQGSVAELDRLYKELQLRNKLNQEQNAKLQQQRENLNKRNLEVAAMDRRVAELRERLWKKKATLQQKENLPNGFPVKDKASKGNHHKLPPDGHPPQQTGPSRVAAVGPYIQSSTMPRSSERHEQLVKPTYPDGTATLPVQDGPFKVQVRSATGTPSTGVKGSEWSTISTESNSSHGQSSTLPRMPTRTSTEQEDPEVQKREKEKKLRPFSMFEPTEPAAASLRRNQSSEDLLRDGQNQGKVPVKVPPPVPSKPKQVNFPSGALSAYGKPGLNAGTFPGKAKPPGMMSQSHTLPLPPKQEPPPAAAVRPFTPELPTPKEPGSQAFQKPQTVAASSIYSMYTQRPTPVKTFQPVSQGSLPRGSGRSSAFVSVYGKPVIQGGVQQSQYPENPYAERTSTAEVDQAPSTSVGENQETERVPRPLSPTKLLPFITNPYRHQSDVDLEALRKKLANAPRPLKKRSSITEPEGPGGPNIQKLLYQKTTLAAMETVTTPLPASQPREEDEEESEERGRKAEAAPPEAPPPTETLPAAETASLNDEVILPPPPPSRPAPTLEDTLGLLPPPSTEEEESTLTPSTDDFQEEFPPYPPPPYPSGGEQDSLGEDTFSLQPPEITGQTTLPPDKRTNLRKAGSERIAHSMRVKFNPLALLLDSSLEGEFDLVQRIIYEVEDPSQPNDEGITALHNAVCAGHTEIVKFLVQFGVNVNAADSDGWTPLHCAASCNNVQVCKFLVESGAAVFATTYSDMQTAADKCEEMEEGYTQCSQFLYGVQEKMGIMNRAVVYGLWDYEAENDDELSFKEGDGMTVVRREDEDEVEWWWARMGDKEGYVPRNLLGLYPRIKPRQRSLA